ncbi:hypothetical protein E2320_016612 [Naja naja]|nr:hypothetical protein E2320_016612 [Naja naja]
MPLCKEAEFLQITGGNYSGGPINQGLLHSDRGGKDEEKSVVLDMNGSETSAQRIMPPVGLSKEMCSLSLPLPSSSLPPHC